MPFLPMNDDYDIDACTALQREEWEVLEASATIVARYIVAERRTLDVRI